MFIFIILIGMLFIYKKIHDSKKIKEKLKIEEEKKKKLELQVAIIKMKADALKEKIRFLKKTKL